MKDAQETQIDFVITWVDGSDTKWLQEKAKFDPSIDVDDSAARYRDYGTLKYLLRSIDKFAPWVRNVFLVTNGQIPAWLSLKHPKLKLVKHSDYMPAEYLPTFSSHPIEWNFHRIEGLSENFVYFNDDVLLTAPVTPEDFFKNDLPRDAFGLSLVYPVDFFSHIIFNNAYVINRHFNFRQSIRQHKKKFFRLMYGKSIIKTILMSTRKYFFAFTNPHTCMAFKKSFFELLWEKEYELLDQTCKNKFRSKNDVSIWLVRYWQLLSGAFEPCSEKRGKYLAIHEFVQDEAVRNKLKKGKYKIICVNDTGNNLKPFEEERKLFEEIMDTILGEKSSFEK